MRAIGRQTQGKRKRVVTARAAEARKPAKASKKPPHTPAHTPASISDSARFRAVADFTYDWESWISPEGELRWVNPAVHTLTGHSVRACLRMRDYPLPIVHPDDRAYLAEVLRGAQHGSKGNDLEFRVQRKDGAVLWVAISWQSIRDERGRPLGYRTSVRDIDERKRMEERLRAAKRDAEAAARAKAELLAMTSHELRTPIQSIYGLTQLLLAGDPDAVQRRHLQTLAAQNEELLRVVDDILTYSSVERGGLPLSRDDLDPRALCESVLAAARPLADPKVALSLSVRGRPPRRVTGDALRTRQILSNLVMNAIKFTHEGSVRVQLAVLAAGQPPRGRSATRPRRRPRRHTLIFRVLDTGIGIPETGAERIFEVFTQADSSIARRYGGTGLGLSIVRRLCDALGGRVRAERRPEGGSCFEVILPFAPAAPARKQRGTRAAAAGSPRSEVRLDRALATRKPLSILVVDDSPVVRELSAELLKLLGYTPQLADSAQQAVALAERHRYDLILLDVQMPELDGLAAAKLLRAVPSCKPGSCTIMALTADLFAKADSLAVGSGIDGFLVKPLRLPELQRLIEDLDRVQARSVGSIRDLARQLSRSGELDPMVIEDLLTEPSRDGRSMLHKLVAPVLDGSAELLQALDDATRGGDVARACRLAHRLRGDLLVVGASRAAKQALALESALTDRKLEQAHALLPRVQRSVARVTRILSTLR